MITATTEDEIYLAKLSSTFKTYIYNRQHLCATLLDKLYSSYFHCNIHTTAMASTKARVRVDISRGALPKLQCS
jgi:hypothetical protein